MFAGMFAIVVGLRVWIRLAGASEEQIDRTVNRLKLSTPWLGFVIVVLAAAIYSLAWFFG
jgi:hypothetical protein